MWRWNRLNESACPSPPHPAHEEFKRRLDPQVGSMGRALSYFRRVAKGTEDELVRALAWGCEFICVSARALFSPYAALIERVRPSYVLPALGVVRTPYCMAGDAARLEAGTLRVFNAY